MDYQEQRKQYLADIEAQRWCMYVPKHERPVIGKLIKLCLEGGNRVSVYDGEEYVVNRSQKYNEIKCMIGHAEEDVLVVWDDNGDYLGQWNLICDNGSEDDPMVVISDYSANDYCDEIWDKLDAQYA